MTLDNDERLSDEEQDVLSRELAAAFDRARRRARVRLIASVVAVVVLLLAALGLALGRSNWSSHPKGIDDGNRPHTRREACARGEGSGAREARPRGASAAGSGSRDAYATCEVDGSCPRSRHTRGETAGVRGAAADRQEHSGPAVAITRLPPIPGGEEG